MAANLSLGKHRLRESHGNRPARAVEERQSAGRERPGRGRNGDPGAPPLSLSPSGGACAHASASDLRVGLGQPRGRPAGKLSTVTVLPQWQWKREQPGPGTGYVTSMHTSTTSRL